MKFIEHEEDSFSVEHVLRALSPRITQRRLEKIHQVVENRRNDLCLVMENIYNRGNTCAVMRSLEAFGYYNIHHIELQEEYKDSNRVTQGADKWLVQKSWKTTKECILSLKQQGYKICVTHLDGGKPLADCDFSAPTALCFGNERDGASEELTTLADEKVFIPMQGFVQSFNISVAAALCLQHIRQEQDRHSPPTLNDTEKQFLKALYLMRGCQNPLQYLHSFVAQGQSPIS